jgi:carotenoid cleavage dioxygenase
MPSATLRSAPPSEVHARDLRPGTGELPAGLDGTFLRLGPHRADEDVVGRGLGGAPWLAGLRLRDGRAEWFTCRRVLTDGACRQLGLLPAPGPRRGVSDRANAGVVAHAGRILALGDGGVLPYELGPDLATRARHDFDGTLPAGFSAHPRRDPVTGELYAVAYSHERPHVQLIVVGVDGRVSRVVDVEGVTGAPMMHAFSLTEHYAVLYDLPVAFAGGSAPYRWREGRVARIGLLPRRDDAAARWFEIEPCFVLHPMNAFETRDAVVLDVVRYDRAFDRDPLCPGEAPPALWRWTVDLRSGGVREERLDDQGQEYPTIDERCAGAAYRYGFTAAVSCDSRPYGAEALLRHDLLAGRVERHEFGPGHEVGDPVFVPRSPDAPEGDGWVMAYVRGPFGAAEFAVLDTRDFAGPPRARIPLPALGPRGFHSAWLPAIWAR